MVGGGIENVFLRSSRIPVAKLLFRIFSFGARKWEFDKWLGADRANPREKN